jgi:hypothetical protein
MGRKNSPLLLSLRHAWGMTLLERSAVGLFALPTPSFWEKNPWPRKAGKRKGVPMGFKLEEFGSSS